MSYQAKSLAVESGEEDPHDLEAQYQAFAEKELREYDWPRVNRPSVLGLGLSDDARLATTLRTMLMEGVDDVTPDELCRAMGVSARDPMAAMGLMVSAAPFLCVSGRRRPDGTETSDIVREALR